MKYIKTFESFDSLNEDYGHEDEGRVNIDLEYLRMKLKDSSDIVNHLQRNKGLDDYERGEILKLKKDLDDLRLKHRFIINNTKRLGFRG